MDRYQPSIGDARRAARSDQPGPKITLVLLIAVLGLTASCSSDEPSEARQMACKIAYAEELRQAEERFLKDSSDFRQRSEMEGTPTHLSIRVQESFNNNLEFTKARASQKLENCLVTGYYERAR